MKRVWSCVALLCVAPGVFADAAVQPASSTTDLSIKYLNQLFGSMPGVLDQGGSSLFGGLFRIFNEGVMAVAAIWLIYTITQVLMMTATSEGPQKSIKNWLLWTRVVLGFGLLVPGPSGYCVAQTLMMEVVVQGVHLADRTWTYVLNYMKDGGYLFVPSKMNYGGVQSSAALPLYIGGDGTQRESHKAAVYQVFNSEVCMVLSNAYNQDYKKTDAIAKQASKVTYRMNAVPPKFDAKGKLIAGTGSVYFPGYPDTSVVQTVGQQPHGCGSVVLPSYQLRGSAQYTQTQYNQAYAATLQMAMDLMPYAKQVANSIAAVPGSSNVVMPVSAEVGGNAISHAVLNYLSLIKPVARYENQQLTARTPDFVGQATRQGWFNAGAFYWNLVRWNTSRIVSGQEGDLADYAPSATGVSVSGFKSPLTNNINIAMNALSAGAWTQARSQIDKVLSGSTSSDATHKDITGTATMMIDFGIITAPLNSMAKEISAEMSTPDKYNPIMVSYDVGTLALGTSGAIWMALIAFITPMAAVLGICDSASPGAVIFKGISSWLMPLCTASCGFLFTAGVMLTFYAPIYPYLLFLFGVVGWLLYVAESIVAAPLVAFGMSHPEGHDFMGRAEQALMLALGVFLRPTLMVIGYMFGVVMVYVVSSFLNMALGQVFMSTYQHSYQSLSTVGDGFDGAWSILAGSPSGDIGSFASHSLTGSPIVDCLLIPVIIMMYSMIMLEVVNQCFSAIHQVPDMVLRWIGGPVQQSDAAQRAQSIKGEINSVGQQMAKAGNELGSSASGFGMVLGGLSEVPSKGLDGKKPEREAQKNNPDGSKAPKATGEGDPGDGNPGDGNPSDGNPG